MARKSISWMNRRVAPPLASRTTWVSSVSPGRKRSSPMRSSGPLGTSRMPVASTTSAPGRPRAKQRYHSSTSGVTKPSSLARQGTMAGTHVRCSRASGPTWIPENRREPAASTVLGHWPALAWCRMRSGGRHIKGSGLRDDRGRFDLDQGLSLHEGDDLHDAHDGEVLAHDGAVGGADFLELRVVRLAAGHE